MIEGYHRFQELSVTNLPALTLVFQEDIVAALRNSNADYFVFSKRNSYLRHYFDRVPWAELMFSRGGTYVYKINRDDPYFGAVELGNIGPILTVRSGVAP